MALPSEDMSFIDPIVLHFGGGAYTFISGTHLWSVADGRCQSISGTAPGDIVKMPDPDDLPVWLEAGWPLFFIINTGGALLNANDHNDVQIGGDILTLQMMILGRHSGQVGWMSRIKSYQLSE